MKELLVIITVVIFADMCTSIPSRVCDSCNCHKILENVLHVNCTSTPKFEKLVDLKPNEFKEVHLTMDHMNLTSLQHYAAFNFETLNVTHLSLNYNNIKTIPSYKFSKFKNLFSLSLVGNDIDTISHESFNSLSNLRFLNISYNALQTFDMVYLNDLKNLNTLDLSGNSLLKFESTSTTSLLTLQYLDISGNKLATFPTNALKLFNALRTLNLARNQITTVPVDAFEMQNYLEVLNFSRNHLAEINAKAFPNENKLKVLDLSHNLITTTEFIKRLKHLTQLNLSYNTITALNTEAWSHNLTELLISNNGLTSLDDVLKGLPQLKKLDASWNQCSKIPIISSSNLKQLILDDNAISSLPPRTAGNGALEYLSLSELPHLTVLKKNTFYGIFSSNVNATPCAKLELARTGLQKIEKGALNNLNICELNLSWNELAELPADTFDWDRIQKINLQGNPWHCLCSMQWLLDKVVAKMYYTHQDLLNNLRCHTPKNLEGTRLVHWFNKTEPMLCSKDNLREANLVRISSSTAMIVLDIVCGIVAVALVATGFYLQRKIIRQRRSRKNRRF